MYEVDIYLPTTWVIVVGNALTNIAKRSSEWPVTFKPNSMLLIAATLLQHNKTHSRVSAAVSFSLRYQINHVAPLCRIFLPTWIRYCE